FLYLSVLLGNQLFSLSLPSSVSYPSLCLLSVFISFSLSPHLSLLPLFSISSPPLPPLFSLSPLISLSSPPPLPTSLSPLLFLSPAHSDQSRPNHLSDQGLS